MAFTTTQLETLESAIAEGVRTVRYGDKEVTYQTLEQMIRLRRLMRIELGLEQGQVKYYAKHSKGLE